MATAFAEDLNRTGNETTAIPPVDRWVLNQRRIYVLPTRFGYLYCTVLLVMLLGSINYSSSLGHGLTFLLGSLFLVALLHTHFNLAALEVVAARTPPVFAGNTAAFALVIGNRSGRPRYALQLDAVGKGRERRNSRLAHRIGMIDVRASGETRAELPIRAERRGRLALGRVRISSRFPLGLFTAWSYVDFDSEVVVYPRPLSELPLPAPSAGEDAGSSGTERGLDDFAGFRTYRPGDSPRHINWKAVARGHDPLVKHFTGNGEAHVVLRLADMNGWRDLESRLSQLCGWILECERMGLAYDLALAERRLRHHAGEGHRRDCLQALADHPASRPRP